MLHRPDTSNIIFICSRCGACCRHLDEFGELYRDLDDGTGVCIYYNQTTKDCSQYDSRPLKCRVIDSYSLFKDTMTFTEYCNLTALGCKYLQTLS